MPLSRYALNSLCAPQLSELAECGALELEQLPFDLEGAIHNFALHTGYEEPTRKLAINLIRRTDHAVFEYQQGRKLLLELAGCEFQAPQKCLRLIMVYAISFRP